tara:strand:+ start:266 stop:739 length:474 start_codon:yes stop_codon:yes gene_type:complete
MIKKNLFSFLFIITIFLLDRLSKYLILLLSGGSEIFNIPITFFLNFNLMWNEGIGFGLFPFEDGLYYKLLTLIIILITLIVFWLSFRSKGPEKLGFLMITGGSLGNIFDRLYYSSVIDFIDININNFHWFIFNVADIFITMGVILLMYIEIFSKVKK